MKILLFGSNGQIGTCLQESLRGIGEISARGRQECDLTDFVQIEKTIAEYKPNIIINAAAYTNVDKAESEQKLAKAINVDAVSVMARVAKTIDALLVHYSSDYVFDGTKEGAYVEGDKPNPLSVYGTTKWQAEETIRQSDCNYLILRTSWVHSVNGRNFVNTIINLAKERDTLSIVDDQIGAPTSAEFVAQATAYCIKKGINRSNIGTYHATAGGYVSWYEFAKYILNYLKDSHTDFRLTVEDIIPISSEEYKAAAIRPKNSVLSTDLIKKTFDLDIPSWKQQVDPILSQIKSKIASDVS